MRLSQQVLLYAAAGLLAASAAAQAAPLKVVTVNAPAVNCIYNTSCKITVNDSIGNIPIPGIAGTARLQSRHFTGSAGAPAAGKNGYMYRVDLTQAVGILNPTCVSAIKLDFGPVLKFDYNKSGSLDDVFVITSGGLGNVAVASADKVGNVITFTFSNGVCTGASAGKGDTSFFFGLTANTAPKAITAQAQVQGGPLVSVQARVPNH